MKFQFQAQHANGSTVQTYILAEEVPDPNDVVYAFLQHLSEVYGYDLTEEFAPMEFVERKAAAVAADTVQALFDLGLIEHAIPSVILCPDCLHDQDDDFDC